MDPEVQWLWYEPGDWDCHDREEVLATLAARRREGLVTGLDAVISADERVFVEITGPRSTEWGLPGGRACMVVTVRDGRIVRMQHYRSRADALAGAGLAAETDPTGRRTQARRRPPRWTPTARWRSRSTEVIRSGDAAALELLLREHPELATARSG